ncbi:MAG: hypothetical protein WCJ09_07320 [Planctomycetota bacterium]
MNFSEPSGLESFHKFVGKQLASEAAVLMSPEEVLALWRIKQENLAGIREGLDDVSAGKTKTLEMFDHDFRQRHGIAGTT